MKRDEAVLVSACLMGVSCRYDGTGALNPKIKELMECASVVPVCPEILGGLPTVRPPAECAGDRVVTASGIDVTENFMRGANEVNKLCKLYDTKYALLKERSPSCGAGEIYDGSFSRTRISGDGITVKLLKANGVQVFGETQIDKLIELLKGDKRI